MKKMLVLLFVLLSTGCATPSKPASSADTLPRGYGVAVFSTIDDGSTTDYRGIGNRAFVAAFTLGMSEIDDGDDVQLYFYKRAKDESRAEVTNSDSSFYVFHPYLTKERALTKKWHILKLQEGDYELKKLTLRTGNIHKTVNYKNGYSFSVKSGEALFLGELKLALKKTKEWKFESGNSVDINSPFITRIEWDTGEATQQLLAYKNYPKKLNSAKAEQPAQEYKVSS